MRMVERLWGRSGKKQGLAGGEKGSGGMGEVSTFGILRLRSPQGARRPAPRMTAGVVAALLGVAGASGQAVTAVPQLDMGRFVGVWYEVAGIAPKKDKCASDALAIYTAGDKKRRWAVVNSCKAKDGSIETKNGTVKPQDKSGDGKLKVAYTWPFYHKQWVVAVGPEYAWAVVGSPDHKRLAVLSRSRTVGVEVLAGIKGTVAGEGFDVGKMVEVKVTR